MKLELVGLIALGVVNLIMGVLIAFVWFRLLSLRKLILDVESRISRVEILTSLAESKPQRAAKA